MSSFTGATGLSDWTAIKHTDPGQPDDTIITNWDTPLYPNFPGAADNVTVGGHATNASGEIASLTVGGDVTGGSLTVDGNLNISGSLNNMILTTGASNVTWAGGGTINLISPTGGIAGLNSKNLPNVTITNHDVVNGSFSIAGASGTFKFINDDLVDSNVTNGTIEFGWGQQNTIVNNSLITASGSGADVSFTVYDHAGNATGTSTIDNTGGGTLSATGTNSSISFTASTVIGGTLHANSGAALRILLGNTFDGTTTPVTVDGTIQTANHLGSGGGLSLKGTVNFTGASRVDFTNTFGGQLTLQDNADVTFAAGLMAVANINGTSASATLHNNGTIHGGRTLTGLTIANTATGVINADAGNGMLIGNGGTTLILNSNLIEVTAAGGLTISGGAGATTTIDDSSGGTLLATGAGSTINLFSSTIKGGSITASNGGIVNVSDAGVVFDGGANGLTITAGSHIDVHGDTALRLINTIKNDGTITLTDSHGGHRSILVDAGNAATLTGTGTVLLFDPAGYHGSIGGGGTLTNASNTIVGPGTISGLTFNNQSVVNSNVAGSSLNFGDGTAMTVNNTGTIETTDSGGVVFNGVTVNNAGGTIEIIGAGKEIDIGNTTIAGGTLAALAPDSLIRITGGDVVFDGSAHPLTIQGEILENNNVTLIGTINNTGSLVLPGFFRDGVALKMDAAGVSLLGQGHVDVTSGFQGFDFIGATTGNPTLTTDNTITGSNASIGNGHLTLHLLSAGVIDANVTGTTLTVSTGTTIANDGILEANAGTLAVADAVTGGGHVTITNGGIVQFLADFQQNVTFLDAANPGTLQLAAAYGGTITDFHHGDAIDLDFVSFSSGEHAVWTENGSNTGGVLSVLDSGNNTLATLNLTGIYLSSQFTVTDQGHAHIAVTGYAQTGTSGDDTLTAIGNDDNTFTGLDGNDTLDGGAANDTMFAGAGADTLNGGDGNDTLVGNGGGDDTFTNSVDTFHGGNGNDTLYVKAGDIIDGGAGRDFVHLVNDNPININLGATSIEWIETLFGNDVIDGSSQTVGIEVYSDGGNDTITGSAFDDIIWSGSGNDTVTGGDGNDVIVGDIGADSISGGNGNDSLYVDASDTFIDGGAGHDAAYITGGATMTLDLAATHIEFVADFVPGGSDDTIDGSGTNVDLEVYAGAGTDTVVGGSGNDFLWGEAGDDIVTGNAGNDTLVGGAGADTLTGGPGTDALYGNSGNGGDGALDTFVFTPNWGTDFVFDFEHGVDKLDLTAVGTSFAALTLTNTPDGHCYVSFGSNLIAVANHTTANLTASDFLF
jgi:hypothetical protein